METRTLNVFILNDDAREAGKLRKYLKHRFGDLLRISLFFNSSSCMRMLDNHVDLVVVDDYLNGVSGSGKPGVEVLKKIKEQHPSTEVIVLSSNEDVATKLEALKSGAREFILNKRGAFDKVRHVVDTYVNQPVRYLVAEYGVGTFILVFFAVWGLLGFISWLALKFWNTDLV